MGALLISLALQRAELKKGHTMRRGYVDAEHFRASAEECRTKAELFYDSSVRERMLRLAANYERMADRAEQLSGADSP
jgi:hypothetical protein